MSSTCGNSAVSLAVSLVLIRLRAEFSLVADAHGVPLQTLAIRRPRIRAAYTQSRLRLKNKFAVANGKYTFGNLHNSR